MIESFAEQTDVNGTSRLHPAVRRRILTASPNPAMQMHACWDVIAEHAEQLESILRTIATNGDSAYLDATRQQVALLAADGLQLARSLMLTHSPEDADSGFASKTVFRLLSNISILLTALSKCCAAREQ